MKHTTLLSTTLLALVGTLHGSAKLAAPETYTIDSGHTFPRFSYSHMGLSTQLSPFSKTTCTVVLDKASKTGSVDVIIGMRSVNTGLAVFNGHIQGEDFLDTAKCTPCLSAMQLARMPPPSSNALPSALANTHPMWGVTSRSASQLRPSSNSL